MVVAASVVYNLIKRFFYLLFVTNRASERNLSLYCEEKRNYAQYISGCERYPKMCMSFQKRHISLTKAVPKLEGCKNIHMHNYADAKLKISTTIKLNC